MGLDDKTEAWQATRASDICPGMLIMLRRSDGGYSDEMGWTRCKSDKLYNVEPPGETARAVLKMTDSARAGFGSRWGTIFETPRDEATRIVEAIELDKNVGVAVIYAASEHDIGKALPQWQGELPKPPPQSARCGRKHRTSSQSSKK